MSPVVEVIAEGLGEAVPDPLLAADENGRLVFMNEAALAAFGYTADDVGGLRAEDVLPGYDVTNSRDGGRRQIGIDARRRDGTTFPVQVSCGMLRLGEQDICFAIVRDRTEGLHAAAELRRMRDQLAEAESLARIGSWSWDIPANEVTWSDELFRIYGLEPGEIVPSYQAFLERIHPDDREAVDARNRKAFVDHRPFEDVKRALRPDGSVFQMRSTGQVIADAEGNPIRMLGVCEDVTHEVAAERAQAELAAIVEGSHDAIGARSLSGEITSWSPGAERLYGYSAEEAIGKHIALIIPPDRIDEDIAKVTQLLRGEVVEDFETRRIRRDGSTIDVSLVMSPVRDANGSIVAISHIARDITERKRFEEQLKNLADHDPLTGLINRRRFEEELETRVAHLRRYGGVAGLLILDIDNFKYVNDALGHGAGDELLTSVANLFEGELRVTDVLARLGGDEFAVLLPTADEEAARAVAGKLLNAIRDHTIQLEGRPIQVTASIGIVSFGAEAETGEELMAEADRAMYVAKDTGRDRAEFIAADARAVRAARQLGWEHRIHEALEQERFVLHAQPIIELASGEIAQHELLLRMRGDDGDLIPPGAFLGIAERLGLIHAIDRWVVRQALRLLEEHPHLRLEVNLSALSIDDELILQEIRDGLRTHAVGPSRLILEITETAAIGNVDVARKFARSLHDLGCRLALDDFGTGFGSFYYLKHLPADFLKIDGDFVAPPRSETDDLVIDAIVGIARGLGKRTIAERVEDEATLNAVREAGVDFAQGYFLGRPGPLEAVGETVSG